MRAEAIYTLASGASYGAAYSFAICVLMEMQWYDLQAIHANEFFHGPFEVVDKDSNFIVMIGLDETRRSLSALVIFSSGSVRPTTSLFLTRRNSTFRGWTTVSSLISCRWSSSTRYGASPTNLRICGTSPCSRDGDTKKLTDY